MARTPNTSSQTRTLLAALFQHPRSWHYGYELSKQTGLRSGTLYPILIRLSDQGLLESKWVEPEYAGKPPRHAYKLSPDGLALARERTEVKTAIVARTVAGATT